MAVITKPLTLEEFLQLPEEKPALEYVDGRIVQKVAPQGTHSRLQGAMVKRVDVAAEPPFTVQAFPELRITLAGLSRVPDISVFRQERIPVNDDGTVADVFTLPPDIAVEIASPDQSVTGLLRKCLWYVANGVAIALLVDPADRSVLAFRPRREMQVLHGDDAIDLGEVLPRFNTTVDELFAELRVRPDTADEPQAD